ncbi:MAG: hypothetical protein OXF25_02585 [Cyanobacteria bacterium MAG CAR3_bin_5]|nr:hypothetical protein [Cyanobacteria bacterium MAG CAR3_bin_5]
MIVSEAVDTHNMAVTLDKAPTSNISLGYEVSGTATAGVDYTKLPGSVAAAATTWARGRSTP